jgi:hypothetical protein
MDESFPVNLLRNVQPTDRKLSVAKEFVGPKKQDERGQKRPRKDAGENEKREKSVKLYGREIATGDDTEEEGSRINITV